MKKSPSESMWISRWYVNAVAFLKVSGLVSCDDDVLLNILLEHVVRTLKTHPLRAVVVCIPPCMSPHSWGEKEVRLLADMVFAGKETGRGIQVVLQGSFDELKAVAGVYVPVFTRLDIGPIEEYLRARQEVTAPASADAVAATQ